jgi:hypothetical protein
MDELEEFEFRRRYEMEKSSSAKPIAWSDVPLEAVKSFGPSVANMVGDIYQAVTSPVQTTKAVLDLGAGILQNALPERLVQAVGEDKASRDLASKVGQHYVQRYGSVEGAKKALATDPAGVMADLSTVLTAGATLPTRLAPSLSTAARAVDPLLLSAKGLAKTADIGGQGVKQALGLTTGVGGESIGQAYKAGLAGGEAAEALKANMRGNVEQTAVLDAAKQNLAELGRQRQQAYRANMQNIKGDKSVLDFTGIDKAVTDAQSKVVFKGKVKNEAAAQKLAEVEAKVADWKSLDPADFHTPEGLDALKQSIGETLESIPFESNQQRLVVGEVYNAVKNEINKQAPTYAKTMKAYADASEQIKEIEKALSLGKKASVDTAMRKLQSLMRNNVNTNYGQRMRLAQELEAAGGRQLMPSLAGQSLNQLVPRGIQGATSIPTSLGAFSLGGLPLTLAYGAVSSPRLVGEAAYGAGRVAKGLLDVQNKMPNIDYPTMFNLLYQANQPKD